jgi:hypothetical protein
MHILPAGSGTRPRRVKRRASGLRGTQRSRDWSAPAGLERERAPVPGRRLAHQAAGARLKGKGTDRGPFIWPTGWRPLAGAQDKGCIQHPALPGVIHESHRMVLLSAGILRDKQDSFQKGDH